MYDIMFYLGYILTLVGILMLWASSNRMRQALLSISKNSCCNQCQEAKKVAERALGLR